MACPTLGCIQFSPTNRNLSIPRLHSAREGCWAAADTQTRQVCYLVRQRNQSKELAKRTTIRVTAQSREAYSLLKRIHRHFRERDQILEELRLVHDNHGKRCQKIRCDVVQRVRCVTWQRIPVVRRDLVQVRKPSIRCRFDDKYLPALGSVLTGKTEGVRRLSREHRTQDHFK